MKEFGKLWFFISGVVLVLVLFVQFVIPTCTLWVIPTAEYIRSGQASLDHKVGSDVLADPIVLDDWERDAPNGHIGIVCPLEEDGNCLFRLDPPASDQFVIRFSQGGIPVPKGSNCIFLVRERYAPEIRVPVSVSVYAWHNYRREYLVQSNILYRQDVLHESWQQFEWEFDVEYVPLIVEFTLSSDAGGMVYLDDISLRCH